MINRVASSESAMTSRSGRRRSSVVDWISGLTENNKPRPDQWARVNSAAERRTRNGSVASVEEPEEPDECTQRKVELINKLKREVKVIMEEGVTRKSLQLDSPYVTSLCAAVDACLLDGLRRRLLGLFGSRSSFALLHAASKQNVIAAQTLQKTMEVLAQFPMASSQHLVWIREALHMRTLSAIISHISTCNTLRRFYDATSLMLDRAKGGMVAALLLGPCAVSFKRMSEDSASSNVLAEAERGGSRIPVSPNPSRPPLSITRQGSSIVSSVDRSSAGRDYVYSLHHNFKSSLLYGKNNVALAGSDKEFKGYLSLHKNYNGQLVIKWTPNQLMHASSQPSSASATDVEAQWLWKQAVSIDMEDIIYIHLHQRDEALPCCVTLVDCEGVQSPTFQLPAGQHSLVFLSALENGLTPDRRLDPPLWTAQNKEKMLPRLRKRSSATNVSTAMMDYVFRIVRVLGTDPLTIDTNFTEEELDDVPTTSPINNNHCVSLPNSPYVSTVDGIVNLQLDKACKSMKQQILARAFWGWLSYCRHLRTVRKHLLYLVEAGDVGTDEGVEPVDDAFWRRCRAEKTPELEAEFLKRIYWRGIESSNSKELRRRAWPYLLRLFAWDEELEPHTANFTRKYREEVEEWRILEAEVRRNDEKAFIAARQRKSSITRDCSMASDVFEDEKVDVTMETPPENDEILALFTGNLHRIDKDVERCDRNLLFFSNKENLESLRRIMCTYVRRNLHEGYVQGMCDIVAPLLVLMEDEALTLECFTIIMDRLKDNFPQRAGMDQCLSNFRSLIQVVDPQVFSLLTNSSDSTHLYFSYRWFLLDFKRELSYDCTYQVWETIWASGRTFSPHFNLFFALALVTNYRDVIVSNKMDFTDMIKFFNEMAERHDCNRLLQSARTHLKNLQTIVKQLR